MMTRFSHQKIAIPNHVIQWWMSAILTSSCLHVLEYRLFRHVMQDIGSVFPSQLDILIVVHV